MIRGKNIILRTWTKEDIKPFFELVSHVEEKGLYWPVNLPSLPEMEKRFEKNGFWEEKNGWLLICDLEGNILGSIGYFTQAEYVAGHEIGFQIAKAANRGKGIMTEALRLLSSYMFLSKDIPRLQVVTDVDNIACRKVAEKCGYKLEGTMRNFAFTRGEYRDFVMYSLLPEECEHAPELQGV